MMLTIAIPTFNRAAWLSRQLERLSAQNDGRVSLLVSDNGSTDETAAVVREFQGRMPNLAYSRNPRNLGFDGNVLRLYELSQSDYIWFLSDDDAVRPNAVKLVLELIARFAPTVAVLGAAAEEDSGAAPADGSGEVEIFDAIDKVRDYSLFQRLIFLSTLLVKKSGAVPPEALIELKGTNFIQVSLGMALLAGRFRLCLADKVIVVEREPGYVTRTEVAELWFLGPAKAMWLPQYGYDTQMIRALMRRSRRSFVSFLFAAKLGMFAINPSLSGENAARIGELLGKRMLWFIRTVTAVYRLTPAFLLKPPYWIRCVMRFGLDAGRRRFHKATSQSITDKVSGF